MAHIEINAHELDALLRIVRYELEAGHTVHVTARTLDADYTLTPSARPSDRYTRCPDCGRRIGWDGHPYGPCSKA